MRRLVRLGPAGYREMPWKNGAGSTTELAIEPPGASLAAGFRWRVSMAAIPESGPFSRFPGLDRSLVLLEGKGMELDHGEHGRVRLSGPLEPVAFAGEWMTYCRLRGGPCRDFNVMTRRDHVSHDLLILRPGPAGIPLPQGPTVLIYGVRGQVRVTGLEGELKAGELLRIDSDEGGGGTVRSARGEPVLVVVSIRPADFAQSDLS